MKNFITFCFLLSFTIFASASEFSLDGEWLIPGAVPRKVNFVEVNGSHYWHSQEKFGHGNGSVYHTIDQSIKLTPTEDGGIEGTVDFYDSRGCSYRDQKVIGEFKSPNQVSLVMEIPRYRLVRVSNRPNGGYYDRPIYCHARSSYRPHRTFRYICGYDRAIRSTRTDCELMSTVMVPITLKK